MAGHAGAISAAWSGRMLAPGGTGFASQAWVFGEFGEPGEDLRDPERGQGDSLNNWNRVNVSTAKPNAFNAAVVSH